MAKKKSFIIYTDQAEQVNLLNDSQAGKLYKALLEYARTGEAGSFEDGMLQMLYSIIIAQMQRDAAKYEEVCEKRRAAGHKGGAPKGNQNAAKTTKNKQKQAKQPDTDTDTVTVTDTDTVSDSDTDTETDTVTATPPAGGDTHTTHKAAFSTQDALTLAGQLGYVWDQAEAERFLAYNRERGRSGDWNFAVQHWEARRTASPKPKQTALDDRLQQYLALSNRFRDDGQFGS